MRSLLIFIFSLLLSVCSAQTNLQPYSTKYSYHRNNHLRQNPLAQNRSGRLSQIQQQNQKLIQQFTGKNNSQDIIEEIRQIKQSEIKYIFPSNYHKKGITNYHEAYRKLTAMLEAEEALNLKEAIFIVENAYLENKLSKNWYNQEIQRITDIIQKEIKHSKNDLPKTMTEKMLLHSYMSGTLSIRDETDKIIGNTEAKRYDFNDIYGKQDWTKMFVTKLMQTNTGQCHSLPLLYLILAEELQIEAYLAFSPEHSYIKLQDEKGTWYNLELTNGHYTTEIDLAMNYDRKFPDNDGRFMLQCCELALQHFPNFITAILLKAETNQRLIRQMMATSNVNEPKALFALSKEAKSIWQEMEQAYTQVHQLGYRQMPKQMYLDWLASLETEREKYSTGKVVKLGE